MEVRYKTDLYGSYVLVPIPPGQDRNKYSFKMLANNRIEGVCDCRERMEDGEAYLYIDISGKKNLWQEYQEKEVELSDMIWIFQNIIRISEQLRNYLLTEKMIVIEPEFIYLDMEDGSLSMIALGWEREAKYPLRKLAEFFLEKINHKDENGVNAAYHFYRQQSQPRFSLYQFLPTLEKENILRRKKEERGACGKEELTEKPALIEESENQIMEEESGQKEAEKSKSRNKNENKIGTLSMVLSLLMALAIFLPTIQKNQQMACLALAICLFVTGCGFRLIPFLKKDISHEEEEDNFLEYESGETVFLEPKSETERLKLRWKEKGRKKEVELKQLPFTIGKKKEAVSLLLSDPSVSRLHCRFVEKEEKIAIMDLGSTNGTSLNGIKLKSGEILEIEKNDEILIGNVTLLVV